MNTVQSFCFDQSHAARMRRSVFLPLLLILPIAAMFGADSSKSQPTHFLMSFGIGLVCGSLIVLISRAAVNRRVEHLSGMSLAVGDGRLTWTSAIGQSVVELDQVREVQIQQRGGQVRAVVLLLKDATRSRLEGYVGMQELVDRLMQNLPSDIPVRRTWLPL